MAKRKFESTDAAIDEPIKDDSKEWSNLPTDDKVEKLKSLFINFAIKTGHQTTLELLTDGDPSFKLTK